MIEIKQNNVEDKQAPVKTGEKPKQDWLKWLVVGLVGFVAVCLIFGLGLIVGGLKARFSYRWAENYHRNFAGPKGGFLGNWQKIPPLPGEFIEGHGTFGEIIKIEGESLIVKGKDDVEKVILVSADTVIENFRVKMGKEDIKTGDNVVIIGSPNEQGQIEAKLIRFFEQEILLRPVRFPYF